MATFCSTATGLLGRTALGANGGVDMPEAHTLFYLHFVVDQQPVDDFQCLGELTLGRPLDVMCVVKAPQRPDIRHRKSLEDAIGQHQRKRLWSLLNRYCLPSLLCDQRGELVNPLMLALQSTSTRTDSVYEGPSVHWPCFLMPSVIPTS